MADGDPDALVVLDKWFGEILQGLSPGQRKRAATKLGQHLRRSNLKRQQRNVEPDGAPMEKRKSRLDRRGRVRSKSGGKMFRRLRLSRNWKIEASADQVELRPIGGAAKVAAEHHFGKKGYVGRAPDGRKVFTRYPERLLLGFDRADREAALDVVTDLLDIDPPK